MFSPIKLLDLELSAPLSTIDGLKGYKFVQFLVRVHGTPLGYLKMPVIDGRCSAAAIGKGVIKQHSRAIINQLLNTALSKNSGAGQLDFIYLLRSPPPVSPDPANPLVTVAVCTRDRSADLKLCLDSLNGLDYPNLDLLVIDNAPNTDETQNLVTDYYPNMRYLREMRPGLNWARNRAIREARGEIIAFTDDDAVVDPGWITALAGIFVEHPQVMAVTGLVVPYELETEAQQLFERYGGFGRGFERRWHRIKTEQGKCSEPFLGGSGWFGTGANMAYRRTLFERIGDFDPALDVGTVTQGGGDLEMFFRVLKEGHTLVYEPRAVVRHRHRRDLDSLHEQITSWGIGFISYMVRSAMAYPEERPAFRRLGMWWFRQKICNLLASYMYQHRLRDLYKAELQGCWKGLFRYQRALSMAAEISKTYGPLPDLRPGDQFLPPSPILNYREGTAVRLVDVTRPLQVLADVADYSSVRVFVHRGDIPIGIIDIPTLGQPITITRLRHVLVEKFGPRLFRPDSNQNFDGLCAAARAALEHHFFQTEKEKRPENLTFLPDDHRVSIIVATYDRPEDLRNCLESLLKQNSTRKLEIIVVDNHPASGSTPPVVADFPQVILVDEPRQGVSYARNAGISASTGDIIVTIDDDVTVPPDWLEKLLALLVRSDVMVVTGNVMPVELETKAQQLFEVYGALGRGFEPLEADRDWFESSVRRAVPTWKLGGTANAAFRAGIFHDPQIGMFDEALGPGTPTGVGEDTYIFYKVLKAGYTIYYEPKSYVFHRHRSSIPAFQRQIYNYSKGHVAYHLTTCFNDHDLRVIKRLSFDLPKYHIKRLIKRSIGRLDYPLSLILLEMAGNLVGPVALFRARRRVQRLGASQPYIPVSERQESDQGSMLGFAWQNRMIR
ncbi:MAG: glycosyltransferase [Desulfobacteraceae bacterium]